MDEIVVQKLYLLKRIGPDILLLKWIHGKNLTLIQRKKIKLS